MYACMLVQTQNISQSTRIYTHTRTFTHTIGKHANTYPNAYACT